MARPIWTGTLSFGLLNVPVSLMSGERSVDLHFRMLDSRNNTPVRYERVNAETGEEVPWKEIVKALRVRQGQLRRARAGGHQVGAPREPRDGRDRGVRRRDAIDPKYFEKPYVPGAGQEGGEGLRAVARDAASAPARSASRAW